MYIKHLIYIILFIISGVVSSSSAEIKIRQLNPISGENYLLLNQNERARSLHMFEVESRTPKRSSIQKIAENSNWAFEGGLALDGSLSYADTHFVATWKMLPSSRMIEISGPIVKGDLERLKTLVQKENFSNCLAENYCPLNNTISFDSPGGSLTEAIEIGNYITSQSFATFVNRKAICESACVFAFLAGYTNYEGFFYPRRYVHSEGKLGIHQPFFELPDQNYSLDQVQSIVKVVNLGINAATDYLLTSGVGFRFLKKMYETQPDDMYYLNFADMQKDDMFILGPTSQVSELTRRDFFKYCASQFVARYSDASPDLLVNLQSSGSEFLTFVDGKDFACLGVKQIQKNIWRVEACFDGECELSAFGQGKLPVDLPTEQNKTLIYWDIATDLDNGGLGYALDAYSRRSALLKYLRLYAEFHDFETMSPLSKLDINAAIPKAYCNKLDGFNPGLVLKVQEKLNQFGINVGKPDGAAGPNTRKGIRSFNQQRTGRNIETVDTHTLTAMGFDEITISEYKICL